jgi:hypothetical protein
MYYFSHPAVTPAVMDEGYNSPSFAFDTAIRRDDLVREVIEVCMYIGGCDGVSGAEFAG